MIKKLAGEIATRGFLFGMIYALLGALCKAYNLLPKFGIKNIIGAIIGYSMVESAAFVLKYKAEEKKQMAELLDKRTR